MAVRLREAESLAELKSIKQKVMELETQVSHTPESWPSFEIVISFKGSFTPSKREGESEKRQT